MKFKLMTGAEIVTLMDKVEARRVAYNSIYDALVVSKKRCDKLEAELDKADAEYCKAEQELNLAFAVGQAYWESKRVKEQLNQT